MFATSKATPALRKRLAVGCAALLGIAWVQFTPQVPAALADGAPAPQRQDAPRSDFNGDGFADLAIGVPGDEIDDESGIAVSLGLWAAWVLANRSFRGMRPQAGLLQMPNPRAARARS